MTNSDPNYRELGLPCLNCATLLNAYAQYPFVELPRTLELYCSRCGTISVHYMHPPWPKAA